MADFGLGRRAAITARTLGPSGTPMYMAPELFAGAPATTVSDIHSLGAVLWFALAGRSPFQSESLAELIAAARAGPAPQLRALRPELPAGLADLVEQAMAVDPAQRIGSARWFVAALDATGAPTRKRSLPTSARSLLVTALGVAGVIAIIAIVRDLSPERCLHGYQERLRLERRDRSGHVVLIFAGECKWRRDRHGGGPE